LRPIPVPKRHQLYIPLNVAAAIVYRAFLDAREQKPQSEAELEKRIEESARAVSIALRVYRLDLPDPLEIPGGTLAEGTFIDGGRSLQFSDGRPPLENLGVNRVDLDHALAKRAYIIPESRPEAIIPSKFSRPKLFRETP
jgi:hypothetical protein